VGQGLAVLVDLPEGQHILVDAGDNPRHPGCGATCERASDHLAEVLHLAPGSDVVRVDRLRLANGLPIALDTAWLPLHFGALLTEDELVEQPIYRFLEMNFGVLITSNTFHITAVAATAEQANLLAIPDGAAVLLIRRISATLRGEQLYLQDRYYRPDRVHYMATLQRPDMAHAEKPSLQELRPLFVDTFNH
jgi:GntR family transcriptional regulator